MSSWKPDDPVYHFRLSSFPTLRSSSPGSGRCIRNGRPLRSNPYSQNPQQVLTIPGGSASVVVPMVRTTPPKEDKADTSSVEVPTAQSLVAQQGSKVSDDNLTDDDPELLNFTTVEFEIICQMSSWL
jgi:hypothetical protein